MERRIRILMVLAGVNGLLALGAIGLVVWMNEDPVYWFPALASAQGPQGAVGARGAPGPQGPAGPAGVSGDVNLDSRISDLESTVGSNTSSDDYATRLDNVETDVSDLQSRMDTAEASLTSVCDALNAAGDPNLNGVC